MTVVADIEQRHRALAPDQSFICEAPAGSGKTELLTQRLLSLLARVRQPEEVLAITFTRKAAGEMRNRVIRALENAINHPEPESAHEKSTWRLAQGVIEADRTCGWNLVQYPSRLQIKTFDSLCASLANTLPWHSSFATPPQVTEDSQELYLAAARALIASLEGEGFWVNALAQVLAKLDNNSSRLENLLVKMLAKRDAWLPVIGVNADQARVREVLEENLQSARRESCEDLSQRIPQKIKSALVSLAAFAAANLRRENKASELLMFTDGEALTAEASEGLSVEAWQSISTLLLTKSGTWRKQVTKREGFPSGEGKEEKAAFKEKKSELLHIVGELSEVSGLLDALTELNNLPSAGYGEDQQVLLAAVSEILPACVLFLLLEFKQQNCVDFTEVSLRASDALGELESPSDLALALDYKIQHILVDEFQDTSPTQIELLKRLIAGWQPGDGRSMFCVGDAMQSIYGFRNANVGLFLKCLEDGLGDLALEPLRLVTNFRSQAGVVEWVNACFARAFPSQNDISIGAVSYADSVAFRGAIGGEAVSVYGFDAENFLVEEARKIVEIIQTARRKKPDGSIALLVRNRSHVAHVTPALQAAGIPYRAVDLEPLSENMLIQDLMALTHALLRPADTIAWLSVLRAPWCGLSLHDLEAIAVHDTGKSLSPTVLQKLRSIVREQANAASLARRISEDGMLRLKRVVPLLDLAESNTQRMPLRQWVEGLWIALGGPACLTESAASKNAEIFFDLLEKLDVSSVLDKHEALEKAVSKLFAAPDPQADESLQIMTIHKSKGLEFDTVILPSLHRQARSSDSELLRWYERVNSEGEARLIMSPITSSGKDKDPVYAHVAYQEKRREENENCRLLYVACTRAKEHLHLMGEVNREEEKDQSAAVLKAPVKNSLLSSIWDSVKHAITLTETSKIEDEAFESEEKGKGPLRSISRLPNTWQLPKLPESDLLSAYIPYFEHANQAPPNTQWQDRTLRIIGTTVHRLLQDLDLNDLNEWRRIFGADPAHDKSVESPSATQKHQGCDENHLHFWRSLLINYGLESTKLDEALERMSHIVAGLSTDPQLREIFGSAADTRHAEFEITALDSEKNAQQLIIDLLWTQKKECSEEPPQCWIIDYKTGEPGEDESVESFVQRELAIYRPIMSRYRDAVAHWAEGEIRLFLYFPLLQKWVEYEQSEGARF